METLCCLEEQLVASEDTHACWCRSGAIRQHGTRVECAHCCGYRLDHVLLLHHKQDNDEAAGPEEGGVHNSDDAMVAAVARHGGRMARHR